MGQQLKQLKLLVKKNFILLWQRKWQVLFEVLLTFVLLLVFSRLRSVFTIEETCMRDSSFSGPRQSIWDDSKKKLIAISPSTNSIVANISQEMIEMEVFKLSGGENVERTVLSDDYVEEVKAMKEDNSDKKYLVVFPSNYILEEYIKTYANDFRAAILFEGDEKNISYTMRYHKEDAKNNLNGEWNTERLYLRGTAEKGFDTQAYHKSGFLALQRLIDASILLKKSVAYNPAVAIRSVPTPATKNDQFVDEFLPILIPLCLLIGSFLVTSSIASDIVEEKCSKMREIQRMMGLTDKIMWLSWIIQRSFIIVACSAVNTIALMYFGYTPTSDGTVIFVFLLCYYSAHTSFIFFIASLQRNLKAAPAIMAFLTFITYLPYIVLSGRIDQLSRGVIMMVSLLPLSGACTGLVTIAEWEKIRLGIQWSNIGNGISVVTDFSVSDVMLMLVLDIIIFAVLTWYVENVFPGEFGVPEKPTFFLTKSYWFGTQPNRTNADVYVEDSKMDPTCHEKMTRKLRAGINIKNLNKTFQSLEGPKVAVNNLSIEMYEGQITALLGHNGAGKTTTINMLTGMYPPSSGIATVGGHDIITDMNGVRGSMGVCPQHNILFKFLTVKQHLDFFIRLKGLEDEEEIRREIDEMVEALGIRDKLDTMSKSLSGGMKRKLSVGIALSGGSKVVLLDEPSTGMDVSGKRDMWDMLLKLKTGRTIVITTHSMDEADLLGDRIAIMAAGQLVCSGSSLFLKRKYGVGYHLTLVKESAEMTDSEVENLTTFIQSHVQSAQCHSNVGSELSYLLNANEVQHFVKLFQTLEDSSGELGIASFGVSLTTMEEVFMKAGEGHDSNVAAINKEDLNERKIRKFERSELNHGFSLLTQQLLCQMKKRAIVSLRNKFITLMMFFIPLLFILVGLITYRGLQSVNEGVPRTLSLKEYPNSDVQSNIYFADLREDKTKNINDDKITSYLSNELNVNVMNVTGETLALMGSYGGTDELCCSNPFLQLNDDCIALGTGAQKGEEFKVCYDDYNTHQFTYTSCRDSCFNSQGSFDSYGTVPCTVSLPTADDPKEETNYFQNYYLQQASDAKGSFFVDVQGAITLSDPSDHFYDVYNKEGEKIHSSTSTKKAALVKLSSAKLSKTDYDNDKGDVITGWISYKGFHLLPAFQSAVTNLILELNGDETRITATNKPLPEVQEEGEEFRVPSDLQSFVFIYIIAGAFIHAVFTQNPIEERISKSKHLQQISGVNSAIYWLSMLSWDFLVYFSCSFLIFILIIAFQVEGLSEGEYCAAFFLTIVLAGLSSIPLVYIISHLFEKTSSAYGFTTMFFFFIPMAGFLCYMMVYPMLELAKKENQINSGSETSESETSGLGWIVTVDRVLLVHPHYAFSCAMYNLMLLRSKYLKHNECLNAPGMDAELCDFQFKPDDILQLDGSGIGRHLLAMAISAVVYMGTLIILETWWFVIRAKLMSLMRLLCRRQGNDVISDAEDKNVTEERNRVDANIRNLINSDSVVMQNLHRQFGKKTAVQNLTLSIGKGECFGLLGVNGAGKTTTFNMMTGDMAMTSGKGYLYGYDVTRELRSAQKFIGYCPQFDALIGYMTGRELLAMFANLRGVPASVISQSVDEVIRMFNLEDHADKECRSYSGGNKRKLSTGIAIIGSPPLIFLDEPSAGMDPTARRFLWDVLCYLRAMGCSIVLTSHSMEECEALCTRIVIMVNGAFRCLGSIQELKNTYSQGYTVCILMEPEDQSNVINFVEEQFKGAVLKENYPGYLMFSLGTDYRWSYIFEIMETNKVALKLSDYSVSQTSLEQVFLNFAKEQKESENKKKGWLGKKRKTNDIETRDSRISIKKRFS